MVPIDRPFFKDVLAGSFNYFSGTMLKNSKNRRFLLKVDTSLRICYSGMTIYKLRCNGGWHVTT